VRAVSWTAWILTSAFFLALYDIAKKASVRENAVLPTLLVTSSCGAVAFMAFMVLRGDFAGAFSASAPCIALALLKSVIVGTSWIFTFCALRTLPISIATPIRASAPAVVFVVAFLLYGERPSWVQGAGMIAVFAGYWAFSWAGRHEGIDFLRNRAVWCAFAGMCCSACSSLWDKYLFQVRALPVEVVQFWFQVGLVAVYATLFLGRAVFRLQHDRFTWRVSMPLVGILLALADWLYFTGLAEPGVPISVASLLRRASVVITFALGARFFHETNLRRKALALVVILTGIVLLTLGH